MAAMNPTKILEQLQLKMPVALTLEDPITRTPITIAYENVHALLVLDVNSLVTEEQVCSNLYAEMARFQRAAEYSAARAEGRYRQWKAEMAKECAENTPEKKTASGKKAARQGPTTAEIEAYYRSHEDYDEYAYAGDRMRAIAGLFDDLKWAFKMKAERMHDTSRIVGGYEVAVREEEQAERLSDYHSLAKEASEIAAKSGAADATLELLGLSGRTEEPAKNNDQDDGRQARPLP